MNYVRRFNEVHRVAALLALAVFTVVCIQPAHGAGITISGPRNRDYGDRDRDNRGDRVTTIERGTIVPVRTNSAIDVEGGDNRGLHRNCGPGRSGRGAGWPFLEVRRSK